MKFLKNSQGMSLVSVMVAIGLTGVLSVILMKLSEQQANVQRRANLDQDFNEAITLFRSMIIKQDSCNATLQGVTIGSKIDELRFDYDTEKEAFAEVQSTGTYAEAKKFRGTKLVLREMKVTEAEPFAEKIIQLVATFERPSKALGGTIISKKFEVPVNRGTGQIISSNLSNDDVYNKCEIEISGQISNWTNVK